LEVGIERGRESVVVLHLCAGSEVVGDCEAAEHPGCLLTFSCPHLLDCWFFDQNPSAQRLNSALTAEYYKLKLATPDGPNVGLLSDDCGYLGVTLGRRDVLRLQFQVSLFPMKKYNCHCRRCGNHFTQNVQKGVDNGCVRHCAIFALLSNCTDCELFLSESRQRFSHWPTKMYVPSVWLLVCEVREVTP
jgi:hypothetical protein